MSELEELLNLLRSNADASKTLTLTSLVRFVTYAARLKDDILLPQPACHSPLIAPDLLPASILNFLASACRFSLATTEHCWSILKDIIWNSDDFAPERTNFKACSCVFLAHGHTFGICENLFIFLSLHPTLIAAVPRSIYPVQHNCLNPDCPRNKKGLTLKKAEQRQAILYTLDNGPLPVWSVHLYCESLSLFYNIKHNNHSLSRIMQNAMSIIITTFVLKEEEESTMILIPFQILFKLGSTNLLSIRSSSHG